MLLELIRFDNGKIELFDAKSLSTIPNANGAYVRDLQRLASGVGYIAVKETLKDIEGKQLEHT